MFEDGPLPDVNALRIVRLLGLVLALASVPIALGTGNLSTAFLLLAVGWFFVMLGAAAPSAGEGSDGHQRACPKCGEPCPNADAVLGHIAKEHWTVDNGEVGGDA